ncbi:MAG: hypothetical protein VR65_13945 [Desulfobulbaceae bacterium BRH_c16a]|nr:MAG: hypothetical protein VR65_13945 [Desulfobulbaceae bacterium BRH_c16a]
MQKNEAEREVVILITDMVQYSRKSLGMEPDEIKDFLISYHDGIHDLLDREEYAPLEIEPSAGDGCLVIFDKRPGENKSGVCTRALSATLRLAEAIADGTLVSTRMGLLLGGITEAKLGKRMAKFGSSFSVANRLEELCGYFGTHLLMDREIARYQEGFDRYLVNIAKVSLTSVQHPMNIFTLYKPGIHHCPATVDEAQLLQFIRMKNQAMEFFTGNQQVGIEPDFPRVREELLEAQSFFREITGREDQGIERILEYIRETPSPAEDFNGCGMKLLEKTRDSLGDRLFHLSKQLLRAMNQEFYHALVVDIEWEKYFKLEWRKKGETIIRIDSIPDGIYYLDSGTATTVDGKGEWLSTMEAGTVFGEMAYFGGEKRRTATVVAQTDVVLRRISTADFHKLPVIMRIFERIAMARRREIGSNPGHREDRAASPPVVVD